MPPLVVLDRFGRQIEPGDKVVYRLPLGDPLYVVKDLKIDLVNVNIADRKIRAKIILETEFEAEVTLNALHADIILIAKAEPVATDQRPEDPQ